MENWLIGVEGLQIIGSVVARDECQLFSIADLQAFNGRGAAVTSEGTLVLLPHARYIGLSL
jgi:hypothetical protein